MQEGSLFSTPPPAFVICRLFNDSHSYWSEVVSSGSFDLHFSNNQGCWALFHVLVGRLYIFLGKMSIQSFAHFSIGLLAFLLLSYLGCLYILGIALVSCIIWNYFLPFCKLSFWFPLLCKSFSVWLGPIGLFLLFLNFCYFGRLTWENICKVDVRACFAYVLFQEFDGVLSYI